MIIFDCDGVLVDSEILSCGTDAAMMTEAGYPISTETLISRFIGWPKPDIWAAVAEERGEPWPDGLYERAIAVLMGRIETELEPVDGVASALAQLPGNRAVASSASRQKLELSLKRCGLFDHFAPHVYSTEQVARGKPAPDVFLFAAEQYGAAPGDCLVIEDSVAGVTAARAAGMTAIGFVGGQHSYPGHADSLKKAGAVSVVAHMRDLPDQIRTLRSSASG
ncbi:MAG: HAD family phosphatase [Phyllobacteriaceae bacterium]|jgi:HAD superfamily hydrolase (TIGR01509 family)|nr:HAD family phosphatase [Phyllobacteriaceae bacterium]